MPSFETAARTVFAEVSRSFRNAKHKEQWIHSLEDFVFPRIGSLPVDELRAAHIAEVLNPIWLSKPETASRVRQRCDAVMKWCAAQGFIVASRWGWSASCWPSSPASANGSSTTLPSRGGTSPASSQPNSRASMPRPGDRCSSC